MSIIINIHAIQIFDSRGNPTIEVDVTTENGISGRAARKCFHDLEKQLKENLDKRLPKIIILRI